MSAKIKKREEIARDVTIIGAIINLILVLLKLISGIFGRSSAMIADSVHSISDFVTDFVVIVSMRMTSKPVNENYHYGHGKFETFATFMVGIVLFFVGFGIGLNSIKSIYSYCFKNSVLQTPGILALVAAAISIITKEFLYHWTFRTGKKINSPIMIANAWHHRSDALSSIATFFGIGAAYLLGDKWVVLDPIAALLVAFLIVKIAFDVARTSVGELLEASLSLDIQKNILTVISETEGVIDPHNLRTRKIGTTYAIDVHIRVDKNLLITEAHHIATDVEDRIMAEFGKGTIFSIHMEPVK